MRNSRFVVFACISAFVVCGFTSSAFAALPPKTVTVKPLGQNVIIKPGGNTHQYTATVLDKNSKNVSATVDWSVSAAAGAAGCSIDANGLLTVPETAPTGSFPKGIIATVQNSNPAIIGTAGFNTVDTPFTGGVFIGQLSCDSGPTCSGQTSVLALRVGPGMGVVGLMIDPTAKGYLEFIGAVNLAQNFVGAVFHGLDGKIVTLYGNLNYTNGKVSGIVNGTWNSRNGDVGTWTGTADAFPGAGGKVGSFDIPATKTPKAADIHGVMAVIFENGIFTGLAVRRDNGQVKGEEPLAGVWSTDPDGVVFFGFVEPETGTATNASTTATGTYSTKKKTASGSMLDGAAAKVGTWTLKDM